jgi:hypothetical protein
VRRFDNRNGPRQPSGSRRTTVTIVMLVGAVVWFASIAGCGKEARVQVAPVRGRVTYRGQGVPKAAVIFFPGEDVVEKAKKMRPFAYTDVQGNFELETYADGDGAPLGAYRVSIVAVSNTTAPKFQKDRRPGEASTISAPAIAIPPEVTKKYGSVDSSGIQVTVHDGENNLDPFSL